MSVDPYCYPGTTILRNKFEIHDEREFTADLARTAGYDLDWEPTGSTRQSRSSLYVARDHAFQHREYRRLKDIVRANLSQRQR